MQEKLIAYYNKFNEDKRLLSRHGQVEFQTTMRSEISARGLGEGLQCSGYRSGNRPL